MIIGNLIPKIKEAVAEDRMPIMQSTIAGSGLKDLRIDKVRYANEPDQDGITRNFIDDNHACAINLIGKLTKPVLEIKNGEVSKIIDNSGKNLLSFKGKPRPQMILYKHLSTDNKTVNFVVGLPIKSIPQDKVFKEISGKLVCLAANGIKRVNFGEFEMKAGATGENTGAKIISVEKADMGNFKLRITLTIDINREEFKEIVFTDENNLKREVMIVDRGTGEEELLTLTLFSEDIPKAKIGVDLYDNLREVTAPFKLENFLISEKKNLSSSR